MRMHTPRIAHPRYSTHLDFCLSTLIWKSGSIQRVGGGGVTILCYMTKARWCLLKSEFALGRITGGSLSLDGIITADDLTKRSMNSLVEVGLWGPSACRSAF